MLFSELAIYFEKLESTSSRLALIDILADLFRKSSKEDIEKIIYLTQGRIAPFFEATEIGMAEKQVAGAIATSLGIKRDEVLYEGIRIMRIPSLEGGEQDTVTLRLNRLHGWLFTIEVSRLREDRNPYLPSRDIPAMSTQKSSFWFF